jgi:hypothetical protein
MNRVEEGLQPPSNPLQRGLCMPPWPPAVYCFIKPILVIYIRLEIMPPLQGVKGGCKPPSLITRLCLHLFVPFSYIAARMVITLQEATLVIQALVQSVIQDPGISDATILELVGHMNHPLAQIAHCALEEGMEETVMYICRYLSNITRLDEEARSCGTNETLVEAATRMNKLGLVKMLRSANKSDPVPKVVLSEEKKLDTDVDPGIHVSKKRKHEDPINPKVEQWLNALCADYLQSQKKKGIRTFPYTSHIATWIKDHITDVTYETHRGSSRKETTHSIHYTYTPYMGYTGSVRLTRTLAATTLVHTLQESERKEYKLTSSSHYKDFENALWPMIKVFRRRMFTIPYQPDEDGDERGSAPSTPVHEGVSAPTNPVLLEVTSVRSNDPEPFSLY